MQKIGVLYICTGPYYLFWEDFYKSFEEKFIRDIKKEYYVFTDAERIYGEEFENVHRIKLDPQPWPLVTLLRFATFLSIEDELKKCNYLMFSNANMVCDEVIEFDDMLPRKEKQEHLFVTTHPGYLGKHIISKPYDRNKKSLAYVPWNCGKDYVIGAMFGGETEAFLRMSKTLKQRIEEDLKHNIIAKWHDESHLNRYIINRNDVRIISPEYCYPFGMNVDYTKKISTVSKQAKFDVKSFKGQYDIKRPFVLKAINKIKRSIKLKEIVLFLSDTILLKTVKVIRDEKT